MRNANQNRKPNETMLQFKARRARGVCMNIWNEMKEAREGLAYCTLLPDARREFRREWDEIRSRYLARQAIATRLPG